MVTITKSYQEAHSALEMGHFHLAIIDLRLVETDDNNEEGMRILEAIKKGPLKDVMPCIVLTARATKENVLKSLQKYGVSRFIEKGPGYWSELRQAVDELFQEKVKINFDLAYDAGCESLLPDIPKSIKWQGDASPEKAMLTHEVSDLFGKLFFRSKRVYLEELKPGLTGASLLRVQPTEERGVGIAFVAKIGRRDKMEIEKTNYQAYVKPYTSTITQIESATTQHLGALLYKFAESGSTPFIEFDDQYASNEAECIIGSLQDLFRDACRYWYDHHERKISNLPQLYYTAFHLELERLLQCVKIALPKFVPDNDTYPIGNLELPNPITWLDNCYSECTLPVYHSITHGDLTGRNIMVNQEGQCWLIDFYRTYPSHILRDFVILETDIKYRLMPIPSLSDFHIFENALLKSVPPGQIFDSDMNLPPNLQKAGKVILALREIAHEVSSGPGSRQEDNQKEYLLSLLMATLNIVRLRHIEENRKLQVMFSASMLCNELDRLAGRRVSPISLGS